MRLKIIYEFPLVGPITGQGIEGGPYADDVLSDGNLSTGVTVNHYIGPSGVFVNSLAGYTGQPAGDPYWRDKVVATKPRVWARIHSNKIVNNVGIETVGTGFFAEYDTTKPIIPFAGGAYYPMTPDAWARVADAAGSGGASKFSVAVPIERVDTTITTTIYEAWLVTAVGVDAPPCRMSPRDDDHALGGARLYPTPKSQQRSSRGVGYY